MLHTSCSSSSSESWSRSIMNPFRTKSTSCHKTQYLKKIFSNSFSDKNWKTDRLTDGRNGELWLSAKPNRTQIWLHLLGPALELELELELTRAADCRKFPMSSLRLAEWPSTTLLAPNANLNLINGNLNFYWQRSRIIQKTVNFTFSHNWP